MSELGVATEGTEGQESLARYVAQKLVVEKEREALITQIVLSKPATFQWRRVATSNRVHKIANKSAASVASLHYIGSQGRHQVGCLHSLPGATAADLKTA